ncbi:MAG: hypothetical protein ABGZ35_31890 [Planctomycetaceae bacterium]
MTLEKGYQMILECGDVVLLSNRRMFQHDEARHFLGRIVASEGELLKVEGFTFVRDLATGHVVRKPEKRVKVLSLASAGYIVYQLAGDIDVDQADIESGNGEAVLVANNRPVLNLSERTHCGHFQTSPFVAGRSNMNLSLRA